MGHILDLARARAVPSASTSNTEVSSRHEPATAAVNDPAEARYRWRITRPDAPSLEVCFLPELTAADVQTRYPGAQVEPVDDPPHRPTADANARTDAISNPATEARRQRIVAIFDSNQRIERAVVTDTQSEPGAVVVTVGLRGGAIGEIVIPAGQYDGLALLALLERYASDPPVTTH